MLNGGKDVKLSFVGCGHTFCPSCMDIGETERPAVVVSSDDPTTTVVHQIDLAEPRLIFCPVSPSADGYAMLQQCAGLGVSASLSGRTLPSSPEPIHRRWTDHEELLVAPGADRQDTGFVQSRQLHIHRCSQSLRADIVE
jgi:hypothetical protein